MRKHLLNFSLGALTFAVGIMAVPPPFEIRDVEVVYDDDQGCSVRTFSSESGEKVILWSCRPTTSYESPKAQFESLVRQYSMISRSHNRAVVSYFTGESRGFCVLRLDGDRQNDICSRELESIFEFERDYFGD